MKCQNVSEKSANYTRRHRTPSFRLDIEVIMTLKKKIISSKNIQKVVYASNSYQDTKRDSANISLPDKTNLKHSS